MVSKETKVVNEMGFHMRPANVFVTAMTKYQSNINLIIGDKKVNGKSIMNIMAACIKCGTELTVECDGADEGAMLNAAIDLIESGFGE
jgi:phosphocarrier protein